VLPAFVEGNQSDEPAKTHRRRHGHLGHLGQVQSQPRQSRRGKSAAHRKHPGGHAPRVHHAQGDLRQCQCRQRPDEPVRHRIPAPDGLGKKHGGQSCQADAQAIHQRRGPIPEKQLKTQPRDGREEGGDGGNHQRLVPALLPPSQKQRQQPRRGRPGNSLQAPAAPKSGIARQCPQGDEHRPPAGEAADHPHGDGLGRIAQAGRRQEKSAAPVEQSQQQPPDSRLQ